MHESDGCDKSRVITYADGQALKPIPHGKADSDRTYEETVEQYTEEINSGGRGRLSADQIRERLQEFKTRWTAEEFNKLPCHDCGAKQGELHHPGCDSEECPRCGGQYFACKCTTGEIVATE